MSDPHTSRHGSYRKFAAMIATSMAIMFCLMYLNSYRILDHAWFSETRLFMTLIMGGGMVIVMLGFMWEMYGNMRANMLVFATGLAMILGGVYLVRSQITVTGVDYMEGMIPHHSIAILTSERAGIADPRVQKLARGIIQAQRREIREMEWLIEDIRKHGIAKSQAEADRRPVPDFEATPE